MRWGKQLWGEGANTLEWGGRSHHSGVGGEPSLWSRTLTFARWSMWPKGTYDMSSEAEGGNICWVIDR